MLAPMTGGRPPTTLPFRVPQDPARDPREAQSQSFSDVTRRNQPAGPSTTTASRLNVKSAAWTSAAGSLLRTQSSSTCKGTDDVTRKTASHSAESGFDTKGPPLVASRPGCGAVECADPPGKIDRRVGARRQRCRREGASASVHDNCGVRSGRGKPNRSKSGASLARTCAPSSSSARLPAKRGSHGGAGTTNSGRPRRRANLAVDRAPLWMGA